MRRHRFGRQTGWTSMAVTLTAGWVAGRRPGSVPATAALHVDVGSVRDGSRGGPVVLDGGEIGWLTAGLRIVADRVAVAVPGTDVTVVVHELDWAEADWNPSALAGCVAGWAAAEFGFGETDRLGVVRNPRSGHPTLTWTDDT